MSEPWAVRGRRVLVDGRLVADHEVVIDGHTIIDVRPSRSHPEWDLVAPGFVDLQVNGHDDVDVATAASTSDDTAWRRLGGLLLDQGVTSWLPTLVSAPLDVLTHRVSALAGRLTEEGDRARSADLTAAPTAAACGIHLEGPFLGRASGAHPVPGRAVDHEWLAALPDEVRLLTLGPECEGALVAIESLVARGVVVALGHTTADAEQTEAAVAAGARLFTHLFNASGPFHHRAPGAVGAALADDRLTVSLIADGVHVDPRVLRVAWRAKGSGRVVLVTDAAAGRAGADGGRLGDAEVELTGGAPRLADGTLAGSALRMDEAVRRCVDEVGVPLADALGAASTTPADVLGLADRGRLTPGRRADVVALSADLRVEATWVAGRRHSRGGRGS